MLVFDRSETFVQWMQEEYLSELVLLSVKPRPKPAGRTKRVEMVWGMPDLEYEGAKEKFFAWRIQATGVQEWRATGVLDTDAELTIGVDEPLSLSIHAGDATATLKCGRLEVEELEPRLRRARPRPWAHDFVAESDTSPPVADLMAAVPNAHQLRSLDGVTAEGEWPLEELRRRSVRAWELRASDDRVLCILAPIFHSGAGWTLAIQRRRADDTEWQAIWMLPLHLGAREVRSRNWHGDPAAWVRYDFRRGARAG